MVDPEVSSAETARESTYKPSTANTKGMEVGRGVEEAGEKEAYIRTSHKHGRKTITYSTTLPFDCIHKKDMHT